MLLENRLVTLMDMQNDAIDVEGNLAITRRVQSKGDKRREK